MAAKTRDAPARADRDTLMQVVGKVPELPVTLSPRQAPRILYAANPNRDVGAWFVEINHGTLRFSVPFYSPIECRGGHPGISPLQGTSAANWRIIQHPVAAPDCQTVRL